MRVKDLMKRDVRTVGSAETAAEAMQRMLNDRIRHLVVVDKQRVVGVVADRDMIGHSERDMETLRVNDVMTTDPAIIDPDETISRAANRMRGRDIGCLPVVDKGKLVGILTTADLLEALTHTALPDRRNVRDQHAAHSSEKKTPNNHSTAHVAAPPSAEPRRPVRFASKQRRQAPAPRQR